MNAGRDVERLLSDWLIEEAPSGAPDRIVLTASDRIDHTTQRRFGAAWRTDGMSRSWQLAAAAVAGLFLFVAGAVWLGGDQGLVGDGPSPTPVRVPAESYVLHPTPDVVSVRLATTFTSPTHGYSVGVPDSWITTPGMRPWLRGTEALSIPGTSDELKDVYARFSGASQPLAQGQTPEDWYESMAMPGTSQPASWPEVAIGDRTGYLRVNGSPAPAGSIIDDGWLFEAVIVADGRGYDFRLDGRVDLEVFREMLATVTFDAGAAVEWPAGEPPIDTTGWIPFTSQRYDYELAIPPTWVTRPAVRDWSLETDNMEGGDPGTDSFAPDGLIDLHKTAPAGATVLNVFAAPATKEMSDQDWLRADGAACAVVDPLKGRADLVDPVTVDGHRGLIGWGCGSSVAVVFVDDRVYVFGVQVDERTELLRTLLSTVRFADEPSP